MIWNFKEELWIALNSSHFVKYISNCFVKEDMEKKEERETCQDITVTFKTVFNSTMANLSKWSNFYKTPK